MNIRFHFLVDLVEVNTFQNPFTVFRILETEKNTWLIFTLPCSITNIYSSNAY